MKYLFLFLLVFTSGAAVATEPGSQYQQQAEAGDRRAQYYLADTWVSSGDYQKAEYWAGMMFQQGEKGFIEPNKQKALHWLNVSCLEGFDTGCEEFDRISKG